MLKNSTNLLREALEVVMKTPKACIQMVHVLQFIAYTNRPLGFTSEKNSSYDALYHRYRTRSVTSSTYPQHLLQSVRHYNADQLGNARKEYHGKAFEGRQCARFLSCSAFLKEVVPSSVHLLVECLKALHRAVVGVFGQILDPGFENDISTFGEKFMGAM